MNTMTQAAADTDTAENGGGIGGFYFLPEHNIETVREKIDGINRRAARLKMRPVTMTETGRREERVIRTRRNVYGETVKVTAVFVEFRIEGEAPRIKGWDLLAAIDHREGFPAILNIAGEDIPREQRDRGPVCDHCGHNRRRAQTYILRETATGRVVTVGSTCIADFVGRWDRNPHNVAELFSAVRALLSLPMSDPDFEGGWDRVRPVVHVWEAVAVTAAILEFCPWISRTEARERMTGSTADAVSCFLFSPPVSAPPRAAEEDRRWRETIREHLGKEGLREEATRAVEWAASHAGREDVGDYLFTIGGLAAAETVGTKRMGHVASILPAYRRAMEREASRVKREREQRETAAASVHVGEIKKRAVFRVRLEHRQVFESMYGDRTMHRFVTVDGGDHPAGAVVMWWKSGGGSPFEPGEVYSIKATPKEHGDYKGTKQTTVLRVTEV